MINDEMDKGRGSGAAPGAAGQLPRELSLEEERSLRSEARQNAEWARRQLRDASRAGGETRTRE